MRLLQRIQHLCVTVQPLTPSSLLKSRLLRYPALSFVLRVRVRTLPHLNTS